MVTGDVSDNSGRHSKQSNVQKPNWRTTSTLICSTKGKKYIEEEKSFRYRGKQLTTKCTTDSKIIVHFLYTFIFYFGQPNETSFIFTNKFHCFHLVFIYIYLEFVSTNSSVDCIFNILIFHYYYLFNAQEDIGVLFDRNFNFILRRDHQNYISNERRDYESVDEKSLS